MKELACPDNSDAGERGDTFSPCGCGKANDGHCQWCCRHLDEHAGPDHVKRVISELFFRLRGEV